MTSATVNQIDHLPSFNAFIPALKSFLAVGISGLHVLLYLILAFIPTRISSLHTNPI